MVKTTRLVLYGQAAHSETSENKKYFNLVLSWSPDHERQLTFRSQIGRPAVKTTRTVWRPARARDPRTVPYGQATHSPDRARP